MDQGSTMKRSAVHNFAPTVTKFCVMWEGQALPHDTKFGNSRCEIVGRRVIFIWSLIHGLRWSGLIKAEPGVDHSNHDDGKIFSVTGPTWGESTGHQWILLKEVSDAELSYFLWSASKQTLSKQWGRCDLRRHHAHYDITVVLCYFVTHCLSRDSCMSIFVDLKSSDCCFNQCWLIVK